MNLLGRLRWRKKVGLMHRKMGIRALNSVHINIGIQASNLWLKGRKDLVGEPHDFSRLERVNVLLAQFHMSFDLKQRVLSAHK
jgi:hypothetical protein